MDITIFGFDQAYAGSLVGLMDIFQQAQKILNESARINQAEKTRISLASVDGKPILCQNNILLNVHGAVKDIEKPDLFIITSIYDVDKTLPQYPFIIEYLKHLYDQGTILISICTGAFLLAETGLLDGKEATTHWSITQLFKQRYPAIHLKPEKLIVNNGNIFCAAGAGSSTDLAFYLLEKHFGHAVAAKTAKFFVHDFRRTSQSAYTIFDMRTRHNDDDILKFQKWIDRHLCELLTVKKLSQIACMNKRTFERRFKKATGESVLNYIQLLRVETAKQLLETTDLTFNEIAYRMGYRNSGSFRKIFITRVDLKPSEYRQKFHAYG